MIHITRIAVIAAALVALLALAASPALGAPKPRLGKRVAVKPAGGSVLVKPRGGSRFRLRKPTAIPTGSTVDTSKGKVKLTSVR